MNIGIGKFTRQLLTVAYLESYWSRQSNLFGASVCLASVCLCVTTKIGRPFVQRRHKLYRSFLLKNSNLREAPVTISEIVAAVCRISASATL